MDLYLVPDSPENTILLSADGTAHFRVTTMKSTEGSVTYLQRPSEDLEDGLLAEVHTVNGKKTTLFTAMLLEGIQMQDDNQGVDASKFLYRKGRFNTSYDVIVEPGSCSDFRPRSRSYFIGNDGAEYRWKYQKNLGWTVSTFLCSLLGLDQLEAY